MIDLANIDNIILANEAVQIALTRLADAVNEANEVMSDARVLYGQAPSPRPYFRLVQDRKNFPGPPKGAEHE
jgi:hypothetical protein